jgi:Uma2 family endonuclease
MDETMAVQTTTDQFDAFVSRPENAERRFELIAGEITEVVSNNYASIVAGWILFYLRLHLRDQALDGDITTTDGGYEIAGQRYMPDVAFVSRDRQPRPSRATWNPTAPDLAVEVLSPTDDLKNVMIKVGNYLAVGTVVWVADPDAGTVDVYRPGQTVISLTTDDTIDGGDLLPGLRLPVRSIFPDQP